jgi:hypothetical protein
MAAHTDEDVSRMLQAAEDVLRRLAVRRTLRPVVEPPRIAAS